MYRTLFNIFTLLIYDDCYTSSMQCSAIEANIFENISYIAHMLNFRYSLLVCKYVKEHFSQLRSSLGHH